MQTRKQNPFDDKAFFVASWWQKLWDTNNETFMPLFADTHRYLVLKGGGGSGKSIFAGRKILERATAEAGHRFLVCRKVGKTIRDSCFAQLLGQLSEYYPHIGWKANKSDMSISFQNGSTILFSGLDDVEKLKSIYNITGIWIEEASELLEGDFNQLDIRLRGETREYKQIIITFNPISALHWLKKRFFDTRDARALVHESTYLDNRFLDEEAKRTLEGFRDTDEYYYMVYCLGQWGVTGKTVFDGKKVTARLAENIRPKKRGIFKYTYDGLRIENIAFSQEDGGDILLYKEPEEGVPYVIGADTAGTGSDFFAAQVLDNRNGEQVAVLHGKMDEDVFTRQLYCLGIYYQTALLGVETNFSTFPVMELERLRYPKQYVRETVDDFTHKVKNSYGFLTTSKTRPIILSELIRTVRDDIKTVCDADTLLEMLTFVRDAAYRPEAEAGAHDDLIMGLAIAHFIRPQQRYVKRMAGTKQKWTKTMYEDFAHANREERAYLIKKWGKPNGDSI